jgi:uncharacterized protein YbaP (TraB family)
LAAGLLTLLVLLAAPPLSHAAGQGLRVRVGTGVGGDHHGFLWEARKGERHALLMGTLHVGVASDYPPDRATEQRLSGVDVIVLEADLSQAQRTEAALRARAMYAPGEPGLDARIDAGLKADTQRLLAQVGLPAEAAWRMKPWMLGSTLVVLQAAKLGYSPADSTEAYLMSLAGSAGKPIAELEGVEAQFDLLDAPAWPQQVDFLRQAVRSIVSGEADRELRALVAAWRSSDAPAMREYLHRVANSPDPVERAQFARLITARNAGMAEKIDRLLQDGQFYLIAVGALHCFGDDGLVEVLRARGYAVTPVDPGRGP